MTASERTIEEAGAIFSPIGTFVSYLCLMAYLALAIVCTHNLQHDLLSDVGSAFVLPISFHNVFFYFHSYYLPRLVEMSAWHRMPMSIHVCYPLRAGG